MIASFFSNLKAAGTDYLLISGQAAVLHGAAFFSEDIDLWMRPTEANCESLQLALRKSGAVYYKLTPPLASEHIDRSHGFHFQLPGADPAWLDVMGMPPRAPVFADAKASAVQMETEWGTLPVVSIPHLIEIKKTQRLGDYPVISNLALNHIEQQLEPTPADYRWATENIFTLETLSQLLAGHPQCVEATEGEWGDLLRKYQDTPAADKDEAGEILADQMQARMLRHQKADRQYWRVRIDELKQLRAQGRLMPVDQPV